MTDPDAPLTDEDLSAAIDGRADPHVMDRIRSDPAAQARAGQLDAARRLVADQPVAPLDPSVVDSLVARAMAAADTPAGVAPGDAGVTPLVAPPRPAGRRPGPPVWAVAATVVALVAIGLGLIWSGQRSDDDASGGTLAGPGTTQTDAGAAPDAESQDASPGDDQDPSFAPEAGVAAPLIDLGAFATAADLRTSLRDGVATTGDLASPEVAPTTAAVQRCGTQLAVLLQGEGIGADPDRRAFAEVDGAPTLVYEFDLAEPTASATSLISAVAPDTCDPLVTFFR